MRGACPDALAFSPQTSSFSYREAVCGPVRASNAAPPLNPTVGLMILFLQVDGTMCQARVVHACKGSVAELRGGHLVNLGRCKHAHTVLVRPKSVMQAAHTTFRQAHAGGRVISADLGSTTDLWACTLLLPPGPVLGPAKHSLVPTSSPLGTLFNQPIICPNPLGLGVSGVARLVSVQRGELRIPLSSQQLLSLMVKKHFGGAHSVLSPHIREHGPSAACLRLRQPYPTPPIWQARAPCLPCSVARLTKLWPFYACNIPAGGLRDPRARHRHRGGCRFVCSSAAGEVQREPDRDGAGGVPPPDQAPHPGQVLV